MPKFFTNVNLNNNQIQNVALNPQASTPSTYAAGLIYFDTNSGNANTYNKLRIRNATNAAWLDIPYSGSIVNADINASAAIDVTKLLLIGSNAVTLSSVGLPGSTVNVNSQKITNLQDPTADNDAANKKYVDAAVASLNVHAPVQVATTTVLGTPATAYTAGPGSPVGVGSYLTVPAVTSTLTIDSYSVSVGDRILVKNQGASYLLQNGVYYLDSFPTTSTAKLIRDTDYDGNVPGEASLGDYLLVLNGTTLAKTSWVQATSGTITVGVTGITFTQFSSIVAYTGGNGVKLVSGTQFEIDTATLPAAITTDIASQTFTNKTFDTAGTGNVFRINGTGITAKTGTGSVVLDASPTFTGTPLSTTAAVDTNTTQVATTAFVLAQAASATPLSDAATAVVGTSTRFARGDHVHPSDSSRAPAASPTFTGTITTPLTTAGYVKTSSGGVLSSVAAIAAADITNTAATLTDTQTLTNKTFSDSTTYFQDEITTSKKMQFQLSGITAATTRTLTIPDASGTIALIPSASSTTLPSKFIASVTFSATTATVTHNLGTKDIIVQVYDSSDNQVFFDVQTNSTTQVTITNATADGLTYRVVVVG